MERPRAASSPQLTIFGRVRSIVSESSAVLNSRIYLVVPWLLFIEFSEYDECFLNFKMAWKFAFVLAFSALLSGKNCLF